MQTPPEKRYRELRETIMNIITVSYCLLYSQLYFIMLLPAELLYGMSFSCSYLFINQSPKAIPGSFSCSLFENKS